MSLAPRPLPDIHAPPPAPPPAALRDRFGRAVRYLRISVTDRCNLRCVYCMAENMKFLPRAQTLTPEEILHIARAFVGLGVEKIRLTGGEPLIYPQILPLCRRLAQLPGLRELALSTNGALLGRHARALREAGVSAVNISLDSLDPGRFRTLSRHGELAATLEGVEAAQRAGFARIRLNSVILRGYNEQDVQPLTEFACSRGLDLCFIEEMPLGRIDAHQRSHTQCSSDAVRALIEKRRPLFAVSESESAGGPARYYRTSGSASRIGFISPHSRNFCAACNRVRLTAAGRLLLCLGNEHSADLRAVARRHPGDVRAMQTAIRQAVQRKPERHHFDPHHPQPQILRFMNATGG